MIGARGMIAADAPCTAATARRRVEDSIIVGDVVTASVWGEGRVERCKV